VRFPGTFATVLQTSLHSRIKEDEQGTVPQRNGYQIGITALDDPVWVSGAEALHVRLRIGAVTWHGDPLRLPSDSVEIEPRPRAFKGKSVA